MAGKIKVAYVGCGAIAERLHIPDMLACADAEIVAFSDPMKAKAEQMRAQFAENARVYDSHKTMLKAGGIDAVVVSTPNIYHGPVAIDCANAKCHVLVEKPMATSIAEAKKMIEAAKKNKVQLMVNQCQRLFPAHKKAKEIMDSGIMGRVLHVTAMFGHEGPEHWSPSGKWFFQKKNARFGAMADLGVHKADLIRYLTGEEIVEINAFYETVEKKKTDVEDNFVSSLKFSNGAVGTLAASWTVKGAEANYTVLHCSNGTLQVCMQPGKPLVAYLHNPSCTIEFELPKTPSNYEGSWGLDVGNAFIGALLGRAKPYCSGEEGMRSLAVILAAEEAAKTGRTIKIKA
ncbi:MAG: Gfo/Idh/MocA family oxidoreductase [Candidatus Hydrogenedentes bacterium]|nr:Gfo/Idh/MocA family oxidoreductase [Candidatus Hydrogenedentota bacterium]